MVPEYSQEPGERQSVTPPFQMAMLDNARAKGVDVQEGVRVLEVLFEDERAVGVRVADDAGGERTVRCRVVVDAAGQSTVIQDRLGLRPWDPDLKKAAIWTYWTGAFRETGRAAGAPRRPSGRLP